MTSRQPPRQGYEWPTSHEPRCDRSARDRNTGRTMRCQLKKDHRSPCHWQDVVAGERQTCDWIADGPLTFVGTYRSDETG